MIEPDWNVCKFLSWLWMCCPWTVISGTIMWCFLFLLSCFSSCLSSLSVDWWSLATAPRFVPFQSVSKNLYFYLKPSHSFLFGFRPRVPIYSLWIMTNLCQEGSEIKGYFYSALFKSSVFHLKHMPAIFSWKMNFVLKLVLPCVWLRL